jgi:toxin ParE1/3/4
MGALISSPLAEEDLEAIYKYTVLNHGLSQLNVYADQIEAALQEIADDPFRPRSRARDDLLKRCRFYPAQHHFIVYRLKNERVEVGRILHETMDFPTHVSEESFPL